MSNFNISSLFPFRRVKIEDFSQIVDPDHGMAMFTTVVNLINGMISI